MIRGGSGLVIVGAQWGDEGKGKIVDVICARDADLVVRFQGGANAGHTLVVDGRKTVLHLVPSGVLHPHKTCAIGPGCVVDPDELVRELDLLEAQGVRVGPDRLLVSWTAPLVLPQHRRLDVARERAAGADKIGTTGRGIGPAYEDLVARRAVRFQDVADGAHLRRRLTAQLAEKNVLLTALGEAPFDVEEIVEPLLHSYTRLEPSLADVGLHIHRRLAEGARVLFEGAQGSLLDVLHGTYPFVTSSSTVAGNASVGSGVGPGAIGGVLGVTKAYATRVGAGPFPTELSDAIGERLRATGREFGATTGRPRRCGWLDLPALRYAARINGLTALALTKLDVLTGIDPIRIAVGYTLDGRALDEMPPDPVALARVEPVYESLPGWEGDLAEIRRRADLPAAARALVARIEGELKLPVQMISVGPGRESILED